MLAEVLSRAECHRIHCIRSDQFLGIQHVPVGRIFRTRTRPEWSLDTCPLLLKCRKAWRTEQPFELLIDQASVGSGGFALQGFELLLFGALTGSFDPVLEQFVDKNIHAADKEAGHRGNAMNVLAFCTALFQGLEIGLNYLAVVLEREDERDVDVDALGECLANSRNPRWCRRNLHHQVRAINRMPEAAYLCQGALGIVCQVGRYFDAHEPVLSVRTIIDGA